MLKPIYFNSGKIIQFRFNPIEVFDNNGILDFTGYPYVDAKYGFVKSVLQNASGVQIVLHNNDLLAWDTYIEVIGNREVWLVWTGPISHATDPSEQCGASKQRLLLAKEKLESCGIKVRYFASEKTLDRAIEIRNKKIAKLESRRVGLKK